MPETTLPAFPPDVPTHPLLIIDFELIKAGDPVEIGRLWEAATTLGFWYLKNHGVDKEVNAMFDMGAETMALPLEEKMKFDIGDEGQLCGFKKAGASAVDAMEFITISQDDAFAFPRVAHRTYPTPITAAIPTVVTPFIRKALNVNYTVLCLFNEKLGLPKGTLERLHHLEEYSGSEARAIRSPPMPGKVTADRVTLGSHTDFGSLAFLHNRLGGLQVLPPGHTEWSYVKPLAGILRSNLHRVVPPPGAQGDYECFSVVFFTRPGNSQVLRALVDHSPIITDAVKNQPEKNFETGSTAAQWLTRRVKYQRISNRTGPESWAAGGGTEHQPTAV
ncbi:Clavaminate synthase-like protein [Paxillus ammoniavirescens]|nr:Clavaminate synthase-like protein [Paxillus ammoniavirescens]